MKQTILIVDDSPEFLKILVTILSQEYKTIVTKSSREALNHAELKQPDLVLADILMPEMDGYQLCKKLKENPATTNIPVIFLTSLTDATDEEKGFATGAVDFICKPFWPELVKVRIKTHLQLKKYQDDLEQLVTERTVALEAAKKQADVAHQAKSEFLSIVGHELRTPMSGVTVLVDELLEEIDNPEHIELLQVMLNSANAQLAIIGDILHFSALEKDHITLDKTPFDLKPLLTMITHLFKVEINQKQLEFVVNYPDNIPELIGDPAYIRQVLMILVGNAIKFTEQGEIKVTISIQSMIEETKTITLLFEIHDTGIGIPESQRSSLFQPFTQVDSSTIRRYEGLGLGLVNAKKMVEKMGGAIDYSSNTQGSCFYFNIPLRIE